MILVLVPPEYFPARLRQLLPVEQMMKKEKEFELISVA
jgi:hypothetical protein